MAGALPPELAYLHESANPDRQEGAWEHFLASHSELILRVAGQLGGSHDAVMDRYTFVLDELRRDDYHRLRAYRPREAGRFVLWLATVVRRLCLDHYRHRYGRISRTAHDSGSAGHKRQERKRLVDLLTSEVEVAELPAGDGVNPELALAQAERGRALQAVLAHLPPNDRLLLKLHYEEELSARDVAEIMNLPTIFHVYRRRKAILLSLRRLLTRAGTEEVEP